MRKIALFSASVLVLALGVASASAEPTTDAVMNHGQAVASTSVFEGRAAAIQGQAPANVLIDQSRHAGR